MRLRVLFCFVFFFSGGNHFPVSVCFTVMVNFFFSWLWWCGGIGDGDASGDGNDGGGV